MDSLRIAAFFLLLSSPAYAYTPLITCTGTNQALQSTASPPVYSCATIAGGVTSFTGDGTVLNNSGSTGAVTATLANVNANLVFAGPASGIASTPTYRALTLADEPKVDRFLNSTYIMSNMGGL